MFIIHVVPQKVRLMHWRLQRSGVLSTSLVQWCRAVEPHLHYFDDVQQGDTGPVRFLWCTKRWSLSDYATGSLLWSSFVREKSARMALLFWIYYWKSSMAVLRSMTRMDSEQLLWVTFDETIESRTAGQSPEYLTLCSAVLRSILLHYVPYGSFQTIPSTTRTILCLSLRLSSHQTTGLRWEGLSIPKRRELKVLRTLIYLSPCDMCTGM